ncbi:MAG: prepilin-type N-terminal cleavage/methylation domain-containing protein [Planctomycetes bacterium]|nr:prepilin-type N-terminal cleavage/methylation domain-containing protein [Planctomycetota bacterium]
MRRRGGFSLLELIVVVTIMAILAGAAVPVASMAINSKKRTVTLEEMDGLRLAAAEYFRDTGALPTAVAQMETDPGLDGWAGPYLQRFSIDQASGLSQYSVDAWSQPYTLTATSSVLSIASPGLGGVSGDANDLFVSLDVTAIRRDMTLDLLEVVNGAINRYNATWLDSDPLPASISSLLDKLVARGYLPAPEPFTDDYWGDALVADPLGLTPVVRVTSIHLNPQTGTGAGAAGTTTGARATPGATTTATAPTTATARATTAPVTEAAGATPETARTTATAGTATATEGVGTAPATAAAGPGAGTTSAGRARSRRRGRRQPPLRATAGVSCTGRVAAPREGLAPRARGRGRRAPRA